MCGRFSLKSTPDTLERIFGHPLPPGYGPRYNVAPTQHVLAIVDDALRPLRWGLIPFWASDPSIGNRLINARAEGLATTPAYRNAYRKRRCVILADGFYEWQKRPDGKHPMWIRVAGGEPFAFAGLCERWDRGPEPVESCSIVTTEANDFMRPIHDRMPVILDRASVYEWLSPGATDEELRAVVARAREVELQAHEVSRLVNSPANDRPECIAPVEPEELGLALGD